MCCSDQVDAFDWFFPFSLSQVSLLVCDFCCVFAPIVSLSRFLVSFVVLELFALSGEPLRFGGELELVWVLFFFTVASDLCVWVGGLMDCFRYLRFPILDSWLLLVIFEQGTSFGY